MQTALLEILKTSKAVLPANKDTVTEEKSLVDILNSIAMRFKYDANLARRVTIVKLALRKLLSNT